MGSQLSARAITTISDCLNMPLSTVLLLSLLSMVLGQSEDPLVEKAEGEMLEGSESQNYGYGYGTKVDGPYGSSTVYVHGFGTDDDYQPQPQYNGYIDNHHESSYGYGHIDSHLNAKHGQGYGYNANQLTVGYGYGQGHGAAVHHGHDGHHGHHGYGAGYGTPQPFVGSGFRYGYGGYGSGYGYAAGHV